MVLRHRGIVKGTCGIIMVFILFSPVHVMARLMFDFEAQGTFEDNVIGILSDQQAIQTNPVSAAAIGAGFGPGSGGGGGNPGNPPYLGSTTQKKSDYSFLVFANIGAYAELTDHVDIFLNGNIENTSYRTYSEFDTTILGVNTGVTAIFNQVFSARLRAIVRVKEFGDPQRDSTAYGGIVDFKQRMTPTVILREGYEFEKNDAEAAFFSYTGHSAWLGIEYGLAETWALNGGYTYLIRQYKEPADFVATFHTLSGGVRKELSADWVLSAGYEHELSRSNLDGTRARDNIYSLSIRYSY